MGNGPPVLAAGRIDRGFEPGEEAPSCIHVDLILDSHSSGRWRRRSMRTGQGRCLIKSVTAGPCSTSECHRDGSTWAQGGPPQGSCCPVVDSSIVPRACDEVLIFSQARLDGSIGTAFARLQCVGTCIQSACERHDLAGILAVRRARWWTRNLPTVVGASRTQEPDHHGPAGGPEGQGQSPEPGQRAREAAQPNGSGSFCVLSPPPPTGGHLDWDPRPVAD